MHTRRTILAALGALGLGAAATATFRKPASLETALGALSSLPASERMPAVFVGHGTPRSDIEPFLDSVDGDRLRPATEAEIVV